MVRPSDVVKSILKAKTPPQKAVATRQLNKYIKQQEDLGHDPSRTHAAIKAVVSRKKSLKSR